MVETRVKDGVAWRIGSQADVAWIAAGTAVGRRITAAIPPRFGAYATLTNADPGPDLPRDIALERRQDRALVELLHRHGGAGSRWWLGYLDTGVSDIVFPDAPQVTLYTGWPYVFALAGPEQAATWRPAPGGQPNWKSTELPEVMFPEDRAWLVSSLWDDDWACVGGSPPLVDDLLDDPVLAANARRVDTEQDATPPGEWAR